MKKIIILLLCFAILLPGGIYAANNEESVVVEDSSELKFAKALGLISESITDDTIVTRRILADTIASIMVGSENRDSLSLTPPFTDCTENYNGIYIVSKAGIMNGVGNGLFAPEDNVTYAQLVKVLIEFLGYGDKARSMGGYPVGYLVCARNLDIIEGESVDNNAVITAKKLASLLKTAQNTGVWVNTSFDDKKEYVEKENYLLFYKGVNRVRGVITATHSTDSYSKDTIDYYDIKLNDVEVKLSDEAIHAVNYLGYKVDLYIKDNGSGIYEGVYCEVLDNKVLEIKSRELSSVNGTSIYYESGNDEKNVKIASDSVVIYNGTLCSSYSNSIINPFASSKLDGSVKLIDNDDDGTYNFVIVDAFDSLIVSGNNQGKIYNKYRPGYVIDVNDLSDNDVEFTNVLGQPIPVDFPNKGDVISVSKNLDGVVKRLVLTVDTYTAKIEEIEYAGNEISKIIFNDTSFSCSRSFSLNPNVSKIKPGMTIKVYFNKQGDISDFEETDDLELKYGYLVDASKKPGLNDEYMVKIFSQEGKFVETTLAERVYSQDDDKMIPAKDMFDAMGGSGNIKRCVVIYKLNKEDKINYIILADDSNTTPNDTLYRYFGFDGNNDNTDGETVFNGYYRVYYGNYGGKLIVNETTKVFVVPQESEKNDNSKYYSLTTSYLTNETAKKVFKAYGTNVNSPVASIILFEGDYIVQPHESNGFYVVEGCNQVLDSKDGEVKWKLSGMYDGKERDIFVRTDIMTANKEANSFTDISRGDLLRVALDSVGEAHSIVKIFDAETKKLTSTPKVSDHLSHRNFEANNRYAYAKVIYNDGAVLSLEINDGSGTSVVEHHTAASFKIVKCDLSVRKGKSLSVGSISDICDSVNFSGGESMVFVNTYSGDPRNIVIYVD